VGVDVKFWFCDSQKAHTCAEPRLLAYFALMSVLASSLWVISRTEQEGQHPLTGQRAANFGLLDNQ